MPDERPWKCPFCRMETQKRIFRVPICPICLDQSNDFIWVSLVQLVLLVGGAIDGWFFVAEEVILFVVLIVIKHRLPPILDRFVEQART